MISAIKAHLERCYPLEGCGVVLDGPRGARFVPLRNARQSRTSFEISPLDWLDVEAHAATRNERVRFIVHSHADASPRLSAEDAAAAAPGGVLLHPGVGLLIGSVIHGRCESFRLFQWSGSAFAEDPAAVNALEP